MAFKGGVYTAIGDSITWWTYNVPGKYLYASKIADGFTINAKPIQHFNKGFGGATSQTLLDQLHHTALGLPSDLITLGVGMNDCSVDNQSIPKVSLDDFKANIRKIVQRLRAHRPLVEIILLAIPPTNSESRLPTRQAYNDALASLADELGLYLADVSEAYTNEEIPTHTTDGIHPNQAGHQRLFDILWPVVQQTSFYQSLV